VVALVLHYRKTARFALDVLLGAVEETTETREIPVVLAHGQDEVARAVAEQAAHGRRPLVAWSFYTASFEEVARELAAVRAATPDAGALHLAGGPHASGDPAGTLAAGFDLVATGEGEELLPEVIARVGRGEDPRGVPGLAWLEAGRLRTSGRARPVDLDVFPPCAPRARRIGPIEITRGCVWACRFCQTPFLFRARWRHRSIGTVRRWIRWQAENGARDIRFLSPSALSYGAVRQEAAVEAVEALLAAAREEAGPARRLFFGSFPSELRPEHVSARALAAIRRYCDNDAIIVGGQSGSDRMLEAMGRGHRAGDVRRAVALAVEAGFGVSVDLVFGLPGETDEDRALTRALAADVAAAGARVHAHAFMPLPGTPWSAARPSAIDPETAKLLDRLASGGRAHGQWRSQARSSRRIS
jgi:B12-binding domain/radical SAM domain protein